VFASTGCLRAGFWETLDSYRAAGVVDVELGTTTEPLGGRLVERLRSFGLRYVVHNYFPPPSEPFVLNLASPDEAIRLRSLRLVEDALALAAELGSPLYSVHAGFVSDPIGFDGRSFVFPAGGDVAAAKRRFRKSVTAALACASELGVELLVENNVCTPATRGSLLLQAPDEFEELPGFDILLDTGHLNVSAATLGFEREEFVRRLRSRIRAFHLHDNDRSTDTHAPAAAGSWALEAVRATDAETVIVEALFETAGELGGYLEELRGDL
jgi:sugar phosphate isomerase/epimerase